MSLGRNNYRKKGSEVPVGKRGAPSIGASQKGWWRQPMLGGGDIGCATRAHSSLGTAACTNYKPTDKTYNQGLVQVN